MPSNNKKRYLSRSNRVNRRVNRVQLKQSDSTKYISNAQANIKAQANKCRRFIYNYTEQTLSDIEIIALSKGFKYIPTPKQPHRTQILKDFNDLARRMRIKYIMRDKHSKYKLFKLPSPWVPRSSGNTILEEYLDETMYELSKIPTIKPMSNLSKAEKIALTNLTNNKSLVIKPIDKGKACAVVSRTQYIAEAERQLSAFHYKQIDFDLTHATSLMADEIVEDLFTNKYIDKHAREYLLSSNHDIKTPCLYLLVKAHKAKPETTAFAGRPIISGCNAATRMLSEYIDYFLLPIVQAQDTYLKDSPELINLLSDLTLPPDITMVISDVTSLYTNIPQDECINIVIDKLEKSNIRYQIPKPPSHLVRRILELILKRNCFEFNGRFYTQTYGASQGNICSPEISDLVMHVLETEFILPDKNILFYRRYRDDILMFYNGPRPELEGLMSKMNIVHPTLKFTFDVSDTIVTYLDLQIYKGDRFKSTGKLDHRVNTKKTDTHQWLSPNSAHCPSVFNAMIKGESIRYLRACTSEHEFNDKIDFFTTKLVERGYNHDNVTEITSQISHKNRGKYVNKTNINDVKPTGNINNIPLVFVTTFTPHTRKSDLKNVLSKHWHKIENTGILHQLFPQKPLLAYKRAKNISDQIVRSKLPKSEPRGDDDAELSINSHSETMHDAPTPKVGRLESAYPSENFNAFDREVLQCLIDLAWES